MQIVLSSLKNFSEHSSKLEALNGSIMIAKTSDLPSLFLYLSSMVFKLSMSFHLNSSVFLSPGNLNFTSGDELILPVPNNFP